MRRSFSLAILFYRPVLKWNFLLSVMSVVPGAYGGGMEEAVAVFIGTFLTAGFLFGLFGNHVMHAREYPFYLNAGLTMRRLVVQALAVNTALGTVIAGTLTILRMAAG